MASGIEGDFVVNDLEVAVEAKATAKVTADHLRGLRNLIQDHPRVGQRVVVCLEPKPRRTDDGILIFPAGEGGSDAGYPKILRSCLFPRHECARLGWRSRKMMRRS